MRLLICAGGTGGGVSPALAVLKTLSADTECLWVGGEGGMEARLVERVGIPYKAIPAAGIHGVGLRRLPGNLWQLARGLCASRRILGTYKPDALFFTGGYLAAPMALAGWRVPSLLFVPDIEPGMALKFLARFAERIAVTSEESLKFFTDRSRVVTTGYPVRADLSGWTREAGREALHLDKSVPVLLVTGGSKGARSINNAVLANLGALLEMTQVVHISGELDWKTVETRRNELNSVEAERYLAYPYLHEEMGAALAAADLVLSRAGASTLGEYPLFGLPAVLVPYPYAWRYQKTNAEALTRHGAAIMLEDAQLAERLLPVVKELLDDPTRLGSMRAAMKELYKPQAAVEIGKNLGALAVKRKGIHD